MAAGTQVYPFSSKVNGNLLSTAIKVDLAHEWIFNESSGVRYDSIGSFDLTESGTVGSGTGKVYKRAAAFFGSADYLEPPSTSDFYIGDNARTWEMWVYRNDTYGPFRIWMGTEGQGWWLYTQFDVFRLIINGYAIAIASTVDVSPHGWYHVVWWHDPVANQIGISVNGETAVTASVSGGITGETGESRVGWNTTSGPYGRIGPLRVWNRVLTGAERTELYNYRYGRVDPDYPIPGTQVFPFAQWVELGGGGGGTFRAAWVSCRKTGIGTEIMYPRNNATPPRIAIGAVVQISDGAVQSSGVSVVVRPEGGGETAGVGTTSYGGSSGVVYYAPTQAETNYTAFVVTAYKTGCVPVSATVVTTESATPGRAYLAAGDVSGNLPANVVQLSGDATAADNAEAFFDGTGYAGTNNIMPTVTTLTNLPAVTAGWLTATGIAADAITAGKLASDVGTEIASAVWASGTRTVTSLSGLTVDTVTTLTNLPTIPANWLTAAGTASDFGTEIGAAVWASATRTLTSSGSGGATAQEVWEYATRTLTALPTIPANWLTAAGLAADAVTEIQSGLATSSALATVAGYLDTEIQAIITDLGNVPTNAEFASAMALLATNAQLVKALAAVYDTVTVAGDVITLSNGATQTINPSTGARTTAGP